EKFDDASVAQSLCGIALADRLQSRQTDFMHIFNFFQTFFSSIHFEKLKLYNQSTKATPHKALHSVFPRNAWHRKISKSVLDFVEFCRM
ncbi:hypothetical protein, partial [uncultured Ruminococcus sp.]|uniref:hypothetical protein n=1 Tax=uncultured Ruminococcus sp. TaxID=165186 RepID=UPI00266FD512